MVGDAGNTTSNNINSSISCPGILKKMIYDFLLPESSPTAAIYEYETQLVEVTINTVEVEGPAPARVSKLKATYSAQESSDSGQDRVSAAVVQVAGIDITARGIDLRGRNSEEQKLQNPITPISQICDFSLPNAETGLARYRFPHLYCWSIWPVRYWNWKHRCWFCVRDWKAFA